MKCVVQFSGGKDSLATLLWAVEHFGKNVIAVFCDTKWEHDLTYQHVKEVIEKLGVELVTLTGKQSFVGLAKAKKRFPSTKARFCTEELKVKPFIDWVLDQKDNLLICQGIRKDESLARSKMQDSCTFFRYYFEPYKIDKAGRKRYHTYRKKEVVEFCSKWAQDIIRPIFEWTAKQVFDYIKKQGFEPNPLYMLGFKRVGCFPCIMCTHGELKEIAQSFPETLHKLKDAEVEVGRSFFPPGYIPKRSCSNRQFPTVPEAVNYVDHDRSLSIFEPETCKSFYSLCE
ncbi:phosphoadenosine phosphosulfate reductase family protein [Dyadobacter sp. Leaf189]|uniref:phosphoadenosine phosphosulfate reductase domain-containing protein n=1 Tax=Dyadobacter sp. Leaf189 TaxID=1736295 RepID=UPI0006F91F11|nr:phosphoadenosine phosphosulfate reductase family protein [Dyadobacter sp. Leaf189]KQS33953.1 sulfate adenylate transferase [Dyadobacter sp. Leaf189]